MFKKGLFVTFEGGEGSGKTTQIKLLVQRLQSAGHSVLAVKEPGSTPVGERLRELLKGQIPMASMTELLLFIAARTELVQSVLKPALKQGVVVIADRFADSTVAYQGYGRGMSRETIAQLNALATDELKPDVTFLLDLPPEEGLLRTRGQRVLETKQPGFEGVRLAEEGQGRFEQTALAFHRKVRKGYQALAKQELSRWCVINAKQPVEAIAEQVWAEVQERLAGGSTPIVPEGNKKTRPTQRRLL
jgi:dTMP kinase